MSSFAEIMLISVLTAIACSLPGNFLVLRRMSMMTDAISHTVLLGIVIAFLIIHDLNSPYLILGATLMGVMTVWLVETLYTKTAVQADSAIGLLFSLLFSIAVILISQFANNIELDTDCILLGELAFAPFDRFIVGGIDYGARGIFVSGGVLILVITFIVLLYKELKITTFDRTTAMLMGISPLVVHYGLMSIISLTAVASFQVLGSILVIAFMITPAMIASLWTRTLTQRLVASACIASSSAIIGVLLAIYFDTSLAGMMATVLGCLFICSILKVKKAPSK